MMLGAIIFVVINAENNSNILIFGGSGNDDLLGAGGEVRRSLGLGGEQAGALERNVHAPRFPRQLRRITRGHHADAVAVHNQVIAIHGHLTVKHWLVLLAA